MFACEDFRRRSVLLKADAGEVLARVRDGAQQRVDPLVRSAFALVHDFAVTMAPRFVHAGEVRDFTSQRLALRRHGLHGAGGTFLDDGVLQNLKSKRVAEPWVRPQQVACGVEYETRLVSGAGGAHDFRASLTIGSQHVDCQSARQEALALTLAAEQNRAAEPATSVRLLPAEDRRHVKALPRLQHQRLTAVLA